jgi:hypothetical protein
MKIKLLLLLASQHLRQRSVMSGKRLFPPGADVKAPIGAGLMLLKSKLRWKSDGDNRVRGVVWSDVENGG